jgi:hypothetical protein
MFMGSHVTTSMVEQIPVPAWTGDENQREIAALAAALTLSSHDGRRRAAYRSELDSRIARLYSDE